MWWCIRSITFAVKTFVPQMVIADAYHGCLQCTQADRGCVSSSRLTVAASSMCAMLLCGCCCCIVPVSQLQTGCLLYVPKLGFDLGSFIIWHCCETGIFGTRKELYYSSSPISTSSPPVCAALVSRSSL